MNRATARRLGAIALLALAPLGACAVSVAVLAPEGPAVAQRLWETTRSHLGASLGQPVEFRYLDIAGLRAAVAADAVDFALTSSGLYVELEAAHGASRIATLDAPPAVSPTEAIATAIVVRADRADLQRLVDLRGRRVAATAADAFGGWQVALPEFARVGVDAERELRMDFVGYPMQDIVRRVLDGRADAALVRNCIVETMQQRGELAAGAVRILNAQARPGEPCQRSSPLYPDWPLATLRHTDVWLARRTAIALLAMPRDAQGTSWTVPTDYQRVHELFRELQIGPYAVLREHSLQAFLRRWWWAFALAALALLGGALHIVRAEWLVRQRTRQLRAALQEREQMARQAREQQDKLDHLARLGTLGEIASMLAHELAQPLAAIGNFAQGIVRRLQSGHLDAAVIEGAASDIAEQATRTAGILARVRDFSRKRPSERRRLDLHEVLQGCARLFAGLQPDAPVVAVPPTGQVPALVMGDRLQLEQVLLNLFKNAQDATSTLTDRTPVLAASCEDHADAGFTVRVMDNGPGLPEAELERVFEPFFTTKPGGVGLGLALAQRVIESHGGRLWAERGPQGLGLAVCFTLPRAASADWEDGHDG